MCLFFLSFFLGIFGELGAGCINIMGNLDCGLSMISSDGSRFHCILFHDSLSCGAPLGYSTSRDVTVCVKSVGGIEAQGACTGFYTMYMLSLLPVVLCIICSTTEHDYERLVV